MVTNEQQELAAAVMGSSAVDGYLGMDLGVHLFVENLEAWMSYREDQACGEAFSSVFSDEAGEDEEIFFNDLEGDAESNDSSADSKAIFRSNGYQPRVIYNSENEDEPETVRNSRREDLK